MGHFMVLGTATPRKVLQILEVHRGSLLLSGLESSDANAYEPYIRARLGTTAQFCKVVVLTQMCDALVTRVAHAHFFQVVVLTLHIFVK